MPERNQLAFQKHISQLNISLLHLVMFERHQLVQMQTVLLHDLEYFQSNHEGELIDKIHSIGFSYDGIVLNAGGLTHTSVALTDAIAAVSSKTIEVHISNIHAREEFRHHSFLTKNCEGIIAGLGVKGYELAILALND